MNLAKVKTALKILSPLDGSNSESNCTRCAVEAADALVNGTGPTSPASPQACMVSSKAAKRKGVELVLELLPDHMKKRPDYSRAFIVWSWLTKSAKQGVYLFEQEEDHVYNFVIDKNIYLIDTATQIYRKINTAGDCCVTSIPYPKDFDDVSNSRYGYNYINPQPQGSKDSLSIYWWGALHANWM